MSSNKLTMELILRDGGVFVKRTAVPCLKGCDQGLLTWVDRATDTVAISHGEDTTNLHIIDRDEKATLLVSMMRFGRWLREFHPDLEP